MSGCAASESDSVEGPVTVYVSLPLSGPRAGPGTDAADGARLALEQAGGRAGELEVRAEFLDDAGGRTWDPAAVGRNARTAAQDSSAAAYIGELDSEPTRASLPITNDAGIPQVSPGAGAIDLTLPAEGYPDSPERYRPSGEATFARVIPADSALASAAAELAAGQEARRVAIDSDGSPYQRLIAEEFAADAAEVGIEVVDRNRELPKAILSPSPDGTLALRAFDRDTEVAAALDPAELPEPAFAREFTSRFARAPGSYAAYGYEAMALVLQAIENRGDEEFRASIAAALLDAERPESVLGAYAITEDGDSTLCAVQPYAVDGEDRVPEKPICPAR